MLRFAVIALVFLAAPSGTLPEEVSSVQTPRLENMQIDEHAIFKNWGVGTMSCASYVESRDFPDTPTGPYDATFRQWLMGFTTAFNIKDQSTSDLLGYTSVERAMSWIEGYCRKSPDKEFFSAVWEFTKVAYPHRAKSRHNMVRN